MDERSAKRRRTSLAPPRPRSSASASSSAVRATPSASTPTTIATITTPQKQLEDVDSKIQIKAVRLYDLCFAAKGLDHAFSVQELQAFGATKGQEELLEACNYLLATLQFIVYQKGGATLYKLRDKQKALKLLHLPDSAYNIIYGHIAGMGRLGCWRKSIEKTNLHINTITKGLKELLSVGLIKEFKTAKNPTKRMYILSELEPTEESSGGSFYNDGELDEALVNIVGIVALNYVETTSWIEVPKEKGKPKESPKDPKSKKQQKLVIVEEQRTTPLILDGPKFRPSKSSANSGHLLVPHPPSFTDYPTAQDILTHIESSGLLKDIQLNLSDINQLIQTLILDDRLEEMTEGRYRTVRRAWKDKIRSNDPQSAPLIGPVDMDDEGIGPGVGLTEIPCGRCPVKQDCRIGGKINPDNCQYMAKWLSF